MDNFIPDPNSQPQQQYPQPAFQTPQPDYNQNPQQPVNTIYDPDQDFFGQQQNPAPTSTTQNQLKPIPEGQIPFVAPPPVPQPGVPLTPSYGQLPGTPGVPITPQQPNMTPGPTVTPSVAAPLYSPGKPGILGGIVPEMPAVLETVKPPEIFKGETEKTAPPEKPKTLERLVLKPSTPVVETINKEEPLIKPAGSAKSPDKVTVDKTKDLTRLHHLHPTDKLTSIADEEEEEFIKDVEAAHGHQ